MRLHTTLTASLLALAPSTTLYAQETPPPKPAPAAVAVDADSSEHGVLGLRGSLTRADVGGDRHNAAGLVLAGYGEAFRGDGFFSARASHAFAIGGGSGGFEGALGGLFALGLRAPIGPHGGLFARGAFRGELLGNSVFYFSRLELPEGQLGYQLIARDVQLEVGATVAPVLAGKLRIGDLPSRDLSGTLALGGFATVQTEHLQVSLDVWRVAPDGLAGAVRMAQASLCLRAIPLALCGDLRAIGDEGNGPLQQRMLYGGLTLGVTGP